MRKALLRKQLQELLYALFRSKKKGAKRSKLGKLGFGILFVYVFGALGLLFYMISNTLCAPLVGAGLGWFYFALMGLMATVFGAFGSVFSTYSSLYAAKDNELLLSLPIPPSVILQTRLLGVYLLSLLFEAVVLIPAAAAYWLTVPLGAVSLLCLLLTLLLLPLLALVLSCLLGWVIALIMPHVKNKSIVSTLLSLVFLGAYFYFYTKLNAGLQLILGHAEEMSGTLRAVLYPLCQMGRGIEGDLSAYAAFAAIVLALLALTCWLLTRSFLRLATTKRGEAKVVYRERAVRPKGQSAALLSKELLHFSRSSAYMLNCGLSSILLVIAAVLLLIKGESLLLTLLQALPELEDYLPLLSCVALCLVVAPNVVTAPSVSIEGSSLWLLQSLPLSGWQVLRSKLRLHLVITAPPALLCTLALLWLLRPGFAVGLLVLLVTQLFILLDAAMGLILNLKLPNLSFASETLVVKQSGSVMLALFGGWGLVLLLGVLGYSLRGLTPALLLLVIALLLALSCLLLLRWLKGKGSEILAHLS